MRWKLALALSCFVGAIAPHASAIALLSPTIIVNGDPPLPFTLVTSTSFGFSSDATGGGDFGFTNGTGQTWSRLDIFVTLPNFETVTCGSVAFATCTVTTLTPAGSSPATYDLIFGPNPVGGITNQQNFTIDLNDNAVVNTDPNGGGSWGAGTNFDATANAPEPASEKLGLAGFALLAFYCAGRFLPKRFSKAAN